MFSGANGAEPSTMRPEGSMLRLRDIMTTEVLTVSPDLPLRRAVELLVRHHLGGAPVTRGGTLVGVLSSSDILGLQASPPPQPAERSDGVEPVDLVDHLPEEDDGDTSFFWSYWEEDVMDLTERMAIGEPGEADVLDENTVDAAMTREVLSLPASATVQEGAAYMTRHGIHRVIVEEEGRLVGNVTTRVTWRAGRRRGPRRIAGNAGSAGGSTSGTLRAGRFR
jgi:CBS domain-containing protein